MTVAAAPTMAATRSRTLAFAGVLIGGLLCLIAGSQPWWRAKGDGASVTFSGTDATAGLTQALGVVALVGGVLALALRAGGRRVLGVLLALAGIAVAVLGALRLRPGAGAVQDKVRQVSLMDDYTLDPTLWNVGYAAAGVLILLAAALMTIRAGRWPARPDRFRRQSELAAAAEAAANDPTRPADPALWWKAQDTGVDPTAPTAQPPADDPAADSADDPADDPGPNLSPDRDAGVGPP